MWNKSVDMLVRHARWLTIVCLCSTALPAYWLRNARVDNSIEVWIGTKNKAYATYKCFLNKYGNEEFVVIASDANDPLSEEALNFQKALAGRLGRIDAVDGVLDLSSVASFFAKQTQDWKKPIRDNSFFRNLLLGEDGHTFGLIAWLGKLDDPSERKTAVEQIQAAVAQTAGDTWRVRLAGTPLLNVALDRGSQHASQRFLPIALAVSVLILLLMLRHVSGVVAVIAAVAVTTLWTVGLMVLAGKTFNMVTVTLPSLLVVLSLSGGIHIASRFLSLVADTGNREAAIRGTLAETLPPVLLSNVTTAVGFGSLMISDMQPVVDFGQFAAAGMLISFLSNAMVVPGALAWLHAGQARLSPVRPHWTIPIGHAMVARKKWVLG